MVSNLGDDPKQNDHRISFENHTLIGLIDSLGCQSFGLKIYSKTLVEGIRKKISDYWYQTPSTVKAETPSKILTRAYTVGLIQKTITALLI